MNHFAIITNTYASDTPEYKLAQRILAYEANRQSRMRKDKGINWTPTTPPAFVKKKRCWSLEFLRCLIP